MTRYFIEVSYNGTAFHGSQVQGALRTVQSELNKALTTILRQPVETFGASRTDEGVHATCNFYHVDLEPQLTAKMIYNLNALLPHAMCINNIYTTSKDDANARFDAVERQYRYRIYARKNPFLFERAFYYPFRIDMDTLHQTAQILTEYKDFETFSKRNTQTHTFNCTLFRSFWEQRGEELHYVVAGNRFLRGMVRGLVGTQLKLARTGFSESAFRHIIESKNCSKADFSVPGHGLYLEKITYPDALLLPIE